MVTPKGTAEEQLLKLIEGDPGAVPPPRRPALGRWAFLGRLGQGWRRSMAPRGDDPRLNQLWLGSRFLGAVLVVLLLYLVVDVLQARRPRSLPDDPNAQPVDVLASAGRSATPDDSLKPMSVYIHSVSARNPFTEPGSEVMEAPKPKTTESRLKALAKGLVVVGIDRGEKPRAIIEDTEKHRTYFVRVGEEVSGATVARISSSGVVLSYEGEELELAY